MNEPQEPARRHDWEDRPAFREIFLLHAPPLAAEALRKTGRLFYDALLEAELPEQTEPWVRARVRAVAQDLRFSADVLASLGDSQRATDLAAEELSLAMRVETWAAEVLVLVRAIESALGGAEESG